MLFGLIQLLGLLAVSVNVVHAQQTATSGAGVPTMGSFTPIRLIQAQTPEQQQAIQNLIQELQRSSPQLFSALGQSSNQQLAIALPGTTVTPSQQVSQQQQQPQQPQQPQLPEQSRQPQPIELPEQSRQPQPIEVAPVPTPIPVPGPPLQQIEPSPTPAAHPPEAAQEAPTADTSTPLSFALNAMFRTSSPQAAETPSDSLPFGLHFDQSDSELGDMHSSDSSSNDALLTPTHHFSTRPSHTRGSSMQDSSSESESFDEWAGLDSSATKSATSLVAVGLALLYAVAVGL
ncbi:hypothetical protein H4R24_004591 [Coemansia sp. RSA 988]|nr:hypothetical protein H4R24_004591 [Coemansia sp. RSA 988]